MATGETDLKGQKLEVVATGETDLKGQKLEIVATGETDLKRQQLETVATGETDLKGQKFETVATGETDLKRVLSAWKDFRKVGAFVLVEGGKWRSSCRLERNRDTHGREILKVFSFL